MSHVIYEGREFPLVEDLLFAEIDYVERQLKQQLDDWSTATTVRATVFLSVRRVDPQLLSWQASGQLGMHSFEIVNDDEEENEAPQEQDRPTEAATEAAENLHLESS